MADPVKNTDPTAARPSATRNEPPTTSEQPAPVNLEGASAEQKIHELGQKLRTCMFGTRLDSTVPDFRPMAVQAIETDGSVWFISSSDSQKNQDIGERPNVLLSFQSDEQMIYMTLLGRATVHTDRDTIDRYWSIMANNWFDGKDDPRVTVISVEPTVGHYWETRNGKIITMAQMVLGALSGGALGSDGGVDGQLKIG